MIFKVSRTLWSVIRMPMPRPLRCAMILWMSMTAMRVDAREGLVEQDERRLRWRAPARSRAGAARPPRACRRAGAPCPGCPAPRAAARARPRCSCERQAARLEDGEDVLLRGELAEDARLLRQVADAGPRALVHRQLGDVLLAEEDLAAVGPGQAHDHVEGRGLARAVRARGAPRPPPGGSRASTSRTTTRRP